MPQPHYGLHQSRLNTFGGPGLTGPPLETNGGIMGRVPLLFQLWGLRERSKLPQGDAGWSISRKRFWYILRLRITSIGNLLKVITWHR